jgi:hypothetical protein
MSAKYFSNHLKEKYKTLKDHVFQNKLVFKGQQKDILKTVLF